MDRAIVEILNTNALIVISIISIFFFQNIYFYAINSYDTIEIQLIYNKIKNIIEEIYFNFKEYGYSENITLFYNKFIYLKGENFVLQIKLNNVEMKIVSPLRIIGEVNSKVVVFSFFNNAILISSPLYIPPQ